MLALDWARLKSDRVLVAICASGTAIFIACYAAAMALYPGGTWWNRRTVGHSFTRNFLCDLMQSRALNGEPTPTGSLLARLGMFAMLVALVAFYEQIAKLQSPVSKAGRVARMGGRIACLIGCTVPIITSDLWRIGHLVTVVAAFVPSLVATVAALVVCMRAPSVSWLIRGLALLTLGSGALDGFAYLFVYTAPALGMVPSSFETRILINSALPFLQRVATLGLLAWVLATCLHTLRRSSRAR